MSTSTEVVVEALKQTPKGRLSYGSQWDECSSAEKLRLLDVLTSPPSHSPEALQYIVKRSHRLSVENDAQVSSVGADVPLETETLDDLATLTPIPLRIHSTPSHMHTNTGATVATPRGYSPDVTAISMATANHSVIGEITRELEECEQSLDDQLMSEVEQKVGLCRQHFHAELERVREESHERYEHNRRIRARRRELERARRQLEEMQQRQAIDQMMELLTESYRQHEEIMEAKLKTGEEQKLKMVRKIEERRRKSIQKLQEQCRELQEEMQKLSRQFTAVYKSCRYPHLLPKSATGSYEMALAQLRSMQEALAVQEQSGQPELAQQMALLKAHLTGLLPLLAELSAAVEEAGQRGEKEGRQREELLRLAAQKLREQQEKQAQLEQQEQQVKQDKQEKSQEPVDQKTAAPLPTTTVSGATTVSDRTTTELGIPVSMVPVYERLQVNLSQTIASYSDLTTSKDPQLKKYRFDLQKAVGTPINTISAQSGEHLINKITTLRKVLSGQTVEVTGRPLSISLHPHAKSYCCNLLAKKIVRQGEEQVASRVDAAFPIAAVAVGIWTEFPELGELILAHLYSSCPVLVPFYIPKKEGMSTAEHMKLQGYKVSQDGTAESEDIFLKRMSGVTRLYAAIIQTPPIFPDKPHPHGLEHGWAWLARVLNMEPHPTLTATAIYDLLEVAGHAFMKRYGRQFRKLLFSLCKEYVHKIEKVTPEHQRGPLSRLTQFLEECIASGRIPEPKGCLTAEFWRTRSHGIAIA